MTHDYTRHGTTTLFVALDVLTGKVIGECHGRHQTTSGVSLEQVYASSSVVLTPVTPKIVARRSFGPRAGNVKLFLRQTTSVFMTAIVRGV